MQMSLTLGIEWDFPTISYLTNLQLYSLLYRFLNFSSNKKICKFTFSFDKRKTMSKSLKYFPLSSHL